MELILPSENPGSITLSKWRTDPDIDPTQNFAPRSKYFINGEFSRTGQLGQTRLLTKPVSGDDRVPRRGLVRAYPGDLDYEIICKRQGLSQFLPNDEISPISSTNPQLGESEHLPLQVNGYTPPASDLSRSVNGGSPHLAADAPPSQQLSNGVAKRDGSPLEPGEI